MSESRSYGKVLLVELGVCRQPCLCRRMWLKCQHIGRKPACDSAALHSMIGRSQLA